MPDFEAAGARLVVVSADEADAIDDLRRRMALTYPIVSDARLELASAYGVRQEGRELALPVTFVVGRDGHISFVKVARHPVDRPSTDDLLAHVRSRR